MIKIPLHSNKKLISAFEYGIILSETAKKRGIELTPEMVKKMEEIILNEFQSKSLIKINLEMEPNILAVFETSAV
jgi:hypothetical protein